MHTAAQRQARPFRVVGQRVSLNRLCSSLVVPPSGGSGPAQANAGVWVSWSRCRLKAVLRTKKPLLFVRSTAFRRQQAGPARAQLSRELESLPPEGGTTNEDFAFRSGTLVNLS